MNIDCIKTTRTRTERSYEIKLNEQQLREIINKQLARGEMLQGVIPARAEIYVMVPGGADWSNTALDLNECPVTICWTEVEEEVSND